MNSVESRLSRLTGLLDSKPENRGLSAVAPIDRQMVRPVASYDGWFIRMGRAPLCRWVDCRRPDGVGKSRGRSRGGVTGDIPVDGAAPLRPFEAALGIRMKELPCAPLSVVIESDTR
jgi:hypothetical protein